MKTSLIILGLLSAFIINARADEVPVTKVAWGGFKTAYVVLSKVKTWEEADAKCDAYAPGHAWQLPRVAQIKSILNAGKTPFLALPHPMDDGKTYLAWVNQSETIGFFGGDTVVSVSDSSDKSKPVDLKTFSKEKVIADGVPTICLIATP